MPYSSIRSLSATRSILLPLRRPLRLPFRLPLCVSLRLHPLLRPGRRPSIRASSDPSRRLHAHQLRPVGPEAADRRFGDAVCLILYGAAAAHLDHRASLARALRRLLHHLDRLAVLHADETRRADEVGRDQAVAHHRLVVVLVAEERLEYFV